MINVYILSTYQRSSTKEGLHISEPSSDINLGKSDYSISTVDLSPTVSEAKQKNKTAE